jgi:hypothetical protein
MKNPALLLVAVGDGDGEAVDPEVAVGDGDGVGEAVDPEVVVGDGVAVGDGDGLERRTFTFFPFRQMSLPRCLTQR